MLHYWSKDKPDNDYINAERNKHENCIVISVAEEDFLKVTVAKSIRSLNYCETWPYFVEGKRLPTVSDFK